MLRRACIAAIACLFFLKTGTAAPEAARAAYTAQAADAARHADFTAVLADHVKDGRVDYAALKDDVRLDAYCARLSAADPGRLAGDKERLAFWINVYNAFTLKLICDNYPVRSINDLSFGGLLIGMALRTTAWDRKFFSINGTALSLGEVEHKILRPVFKDARIHFAIVCAARSCPPLRSEAYEGRMLDHQLDEQGRAFMSDVSKNLFDVREKTARISKIFSWFRNDFGRSSAELLLFLAPYLPADAAASIRENPRGWRVSYLPYDWGLND